MIDIDKGNAPSLHLFLIISSTDGCRFRFQASLVPRPQKRLVSSILSVELQCEKDVGMGHCLYVDLCFYATSHPYIVCRVLFGMPSLHIFTFFHVFFLLFIYFLFLYLISVTVRPKP